MKKILLSIILACVFLTINAQQKSNGCCIEMVSPKSEGMIYENDTIKFKFDPTHLFWGITIENKTKVRMTCLWDKTVFIVDKKSSQIVFDDTRILDLNKPKGESILSPGTELSKSIFPLESVSKYEDKPYPVFRKSTIKNHGNTRIRLIFPIMQNGAEREYEFEFIVSLCEKK